MPGLRAFVKRMVVSGAVAGTYALVEAAWPRLVRHRLVTAPGTPSCSILHVSDLHLSGRNRRLARWVGDLGARIGGVDFAVATGDLISGDDGIDLAVSALAAVPAKRGRYFVFGSHDYYQAGFQIYTRYFSREKTPTRARPADAARLARGLKDAGWVSLNNATEHAELADARVRFAGVDDPHIFRHDTSHLRRGPDDDLAIAVMHAPDVVSQCVLAGFDVVLAGHTHGGQVRIPGVGAVVTNCTLPTGLAAGPHRIGATWLHVSTGLGTSKYAPIRFDCRPEATILEVGPDLV